jgi:transposase-like protein
MAESQRMTSAEVVAKTLIAEHGDFLREAVAMVASELMEAEISSQIGAVHSERSADRSTHRNASGSASGRRGSTYRRSRVSPPGAQPFALAMLVSRPARMRRYLSPRCCP